MDVKALYAYFMSGRRSSDGAIEHAFGLNIRQLGWLELLFVANGRYQPIPRRVENESRRLSLPGLSHCGACHTLAIFGAERSSQAMPGPNRRLDRLP
jgi:hypothetical protein